MKSLWAYALGAAFLLSAVSAHAQIAPAADPQFIDADDWFFISHPENSTNRKGKIRLGVKTADKPMRGGTAVFEVRAENLKYDARTFYKTRPARPADLVVGRRIIYPPSPIQTPSDKAEAVTWNLRTIVNVADAAPGTVIVAGRSDPTVETSRGLRVIVDDSDGKVALTGREDAHFFHPEHRLVFLDSGEPDADGHDVKMGLAINPSTFLILENGELVTTKAAYRSRPATKADLKPGARVAIYTVHGDPPTRIGAYTETWYVGTVASFDGRVARVGSASVPVELIRVISRE